MPQRRGTRGVARVTFAILSSYFPSKKRRGLDIERQLNYKLQELNLLLPPSMHLQWLKTNATIALIDVNPVTRTCHMLAQTTTREQMSDNDAI